MENLEEYEQSIKREQTHFQDHSHTCHYIPQYYVTFRICGQQKVKQHMCLWTTKGYQGQIFAAHANKIGMQYEIHGI